MSLTITVHPAAECMPKCSSAERARLADDIKERGLEEQIRYIEKRNGDGTEACVYDGRTRIGILKDLKINPWEAKTITGQSVMQKAKVPEDKTEVEFVCESVRSLNVNRRHNNKSQLAVAGQKLLNLLQKEAAHIAENEKREEDLATLKKADPKLYKKVEADEVPLKKALKQIGVEEEPLKRAKAKKGQGSLHAKAAKASGASVRNVSNAAILQKENPKLYKLVDEGEITLGAVMKQHKEEVATKKVDKAAAKIATAPPIMQSFITGDSIKELPKLKTPINLIIADPPYNMGFDYGMGKKADSLDPDKYYEWCGEWFQSCFDALDKYGSMLVIINSENAAQFDLGLQEIGFHIRARLIMKENFGVYLQDNFGKCHRNAFYCVKDRKKFTFNKAPFLVTSTRQEMGDKRATGPKIMGDVIDYTRVCGTFKERNPLFPTQLSEAFVQMFVDGLSLPGDFVLDPFSGSGTTGACCAQADRGQRKFLGIDINEDYTKAAAVRVNTVHMKMDKKRAG